jgi:glycine/D-amino acid oxidase-like deaminating enzyme
MKIDHDAISDGLAPALRSANQTSFAPEFQANPFWWIAAPRAHAGDGVLPANCDVLVVGSGVTGLNAARELARGGRSVVVVDSGEAGIGATSRNAGHIGRVLKHEFTQLVSVLGLERAVAIYREMEGAYNSVLDVVSKEGIDCEYRVSGRVILAYTQKQLSLVEAECAAKKTHLGEEYRMLDRAGLATEVDAPLFVGGAYLPESASLHPGLYHSGLLRAALSVGVKALSGTEVCAILSTGAAGASRFRVKTSRGEIAARDVIVATNGYTGPGIPGWFRRRLIPFDAYMIATEELAPEVVRSILPGNRVYIDANRNVNFFRQSPDGRRILYGGRTGGRLPSDLSTIGLDLLSDARRLLPGLEGKRIGRVWTGRCAGTIDLYPHIGTHDGIHFAAGYCFAGIPMGTYLGRKLAWGMLGKAEGDTMFRERAMPGHPIYWGNPWFVPLYMKFYDLLDWHDGGRP